METILSMFVIQMLLTALIIGSDYQKLPHRWGSLQTGQVDRFYGCTTKRLSPSANRPPSAATALTTQL